MKIKKTLIDNLNLLILSPSKRHTCPNSILYGIIKSELIPNVYLFDSDKNKDSEYKNPKTKEIIKKIISAPIEPNFEDSNKQEYLDKLDETIEKFKINYIIPTSERGAKILASYKKYAPFRLIADQNIIDLFQNKYYTYEFIKNNFNQSNIRTPRSILTTTFNIKQINEFIEIEKEIFVKPTVAKTGGGKDMGYVSSINELYKKFPDFMTKAYVLSEKLFLPEISHTLIIKNKEILIQSSAESIEKIGFSASKKLKTIENKNINQFNENFFKKIKNFYPNSFIDGAYNQDFLYDLNGNLVLSEINPGRLPGGLELSIDAGINYSEILLKCFIDEKIIKPEYKTNLERKIY